jgi:hypothetical protein
VSRQQPLTIPYADELKHTARTWVKRQTRVHVPAAQHARVWTALPSRKRRAQGEPGVDCARSLACSKKAHELVTTGSTESSGSPCAMVLTVSFGLSSVTGLFCHRRLADVRPGYPVGRDQLHESLTPASGRQDHTTSPSASARFVNRAARVHRISYPTTVTIAIRPSMGRDARHKPLICVRRKRNIFGRGAGPVETG